jgi:DNA-binding transcriptional LysR family regulator
LNAAGAELLAGLRKGMRLVEESLSIVQGTQHIGPVQVATVQPLTSAFVLPALSRLQTNYPRIVPHLGRLRIHELTAALLTGTVDLALTQQARPHRQLSIELLGTIPHSVYVGQGHPLHRERGPALERILGHAFVGLRSDQPTGSVEPWPLELQRNVTLYVDDVELAVTACASGNYVAVLPDVAVGAKSRQGRLWRIAVPTIRGCNVYAVRREQLSTGERVQAVLDAIRNEVAERIGVTPTEGGTLGH